MDEHKKTKQSTPKIDEVVVDESIQRIEELEAQLSEASNDRMRALADFHNLQSRTRADQEKFVKLSTGSLVAQLLTPFDHLNMAAAQSKDQGLEMIARQFKQIFEQEGVKEIEAEGKKFDPSTMEAIEQVEGEKDIVVKVLTPGYKLHDYVLRPAKVQVGQGK